MPLKHRTIIGSLLSIGKPAGGAEDARPENDGQSLSKRRTNLRFLENSGPLFAPHTSRKKDAYLHDETVADVVRCLLGLPLLPAHDIVDALQDIRITVATDGSHSRRLQLLVACVGEFQLSTRVAD